VPASPSCGGAPGSSVWEFLSALVHLDPNSSSDNLEPYTVAEHVAIFYAGDDENNRQTAEEVLTNVIAGLPDDKLTGFALWLALTGHTDIPREGEFDFLAEANAVFAPPKPKVAKAKDKPKPVAAASSTPKKNGSRTKAA
jgi:ParB family transcriptional regulator, chromosome partitioning protein